MIKRFKEISGPSFLIGQDGNGMISLKEEKEIGRNPGRFLIPRLLFEHFKLYAACYNI